MEIGRIRAAVLLFIFSIFSFGLIANCAKKETRNLDSKGENIVCFGDSVTFGYGVQRGQDYPSLLARMAGFPVINSGIDGDTSFSALSRIAKDVLDKKPLLVIVEFGVNDFLMGVPIEDTTANVEKMIKEIHSRGAMVAIADPGSRIMMSGYSLEFERLSKKYGAILIPCLLNGIITDLSPKGRFIYPNAGGYRIIAQRIWRVIKPYLSRNTAGNNHKQ